MGFLLKLEGVFKNFGDLKVLGGVDLVLKRGEKIAILGPSGCGKTTLLKIIAGIEKEDSGHVSRNFESLGFVFQSPTLIPWLNVLENLLFVRDDIERALKALEMVGLKGFEEYFPRNLSGGMRQRVNLARALMVDPELVLFDEPFSSLDFHIKMRLIGEILDLQEKMGFSTMTVTHDPFEALKISDRILVMSDKPSKVVDTLESRKTNENEIIRALEHALFKRDSY